jgi:hypothetical protein
MTMAYMTVSRVDCARGAPMGRQAQHSTNQFGVFKFRLQHLPLADGGYDKGGAYWGYPDNVYIARCDDPLGEQFAIEFFVRAEQTAQYGYNVREAAKAAVRIVYPNATFYR